jgi:hypothetical protein
VSAAIVLSRYLDVVMLPTPVALLRLDAEIGEVHLVIEVRQVVLKGPLADFVLGAVG